MAHVLAPTAAEQRARCVLSVIESQCAQLAPQNLVFAPIVTSCASAGGPQPAVSVSVPREHADSDGRPAKRSFACAALDDTPDRPVKRICPGAMNQGGAPVALHPAHARMHARRRHARTHACMHARTHAPLCLVMPDKSMSV
jgi:hypothetical protein